MSTAVLKLFADHKKGLCHKTTTIAQSPIN